MVNLILSKIKEHSVKKGEQISCRFLNKYICWSEFEEKTNQIAYVMQNRFNIKEHVPILIYNARGIEFIEYMIAVLKCGCFYIPLEHSFPVERVKYIYDDVGAALILTDRSDLFDNKLYKTLALDNWDRCINDYKNKQDYLNINESDLIYAIYTSGTSGKPKGVKIMYSNVINLIESFYDILYFKFDEPIQVGVLASFSFDSSVKQIYCSLFYGHTLCIADDSTKIFVKKLYNFYEQYNLTVCDVTPSHLNLMTIKKIKKTPTIPYLLIGGEILRWEILHKYTQFTNHFPTFINLYGPTECCVDVAYKVISNEELNSNPSGIVPIGRSINNTNLTIRSDNNTIIDECCKKGELFVTGKQIGAGYVNYLSDAFFQENGNLVYKTGDIAFYDYNNNDIVVIGRKDSQVKINGCRVELIEIQSVIEQFMQCPCIAFCVNNGERNKIAIFINNFQFSEMDKANLIKHLKCVFPSYMMPNYYLNSASFPLTENGKIDIKQLQNMLNKS